VGAEYDLDCPNPSCNGWMIILRIKDKTFLSLSDVLILVKMHLGLAKSSASLFATKEGTCSACSKHIKRVSTLVVVYKFS